MPDQTKTPPEPQTDDDREKWLAEINATIARIYANIEQWANFETAKAK